MSLFLYLNFEGFENPIRLDRSSSGGGTMLYIKEGIPFKLLKSSDLSANTEAFLVKVKINKKKWLLCCSYNPRKSVNWKTYELIRKNPWYLFTQIWS